MDYTEFTLALAKGCYH